MSIKEKKKEQCNLLKETAKKYELILLNDEVNTFDYVVDCLIRICEHETFQAEQCALITHYNGKCSVRNGRLNEMNQLCMRLLEANLRAEVN